mmetsp:Transcript_47869/g.154362  ORF Transcript_47869/g.154362 Transcript_47869/m.154362 type:complete len:257 (-) Transcript_47869:32-802(-)
MEIKCPASPWPKFVHFAMRVKHISFQRAGSAKPCGSKIDLALITGISTSSSRSSGRNLVQVLCTQPCMALVTMNTCPHLLAAFSAAAAVWATASNSCLCDQCINCTNRSNCSRWSAGTMAAAKWPSAVKAVVGKSVSSQSKMKMGFLSVQATREALQCSQRASPQRGNTCGCGSSGGSCGGTGCGASEGGAASSFSSSCDRSVPSSRCSSSPSAAPTANGWHAPGFSTSAPTRGSKTSSTGTGDMAARQPTKTRRG